MSLLPYIFDSTTSPLERIIGRGWFDDDLFRPQPMDLTRRMLASLRDQGASIKTDKDKFQINLDVQHFAPEEITVKTSDGFVTVEGKHEEKRDEHGYVSRKFVRRYGLPEGCKPESVVSRLSSDGVLTVTAPIKQIECNERVIPIQHTGPVRKEIKDNSVAQSGGNNK